MRNFYCLITLREFMFITICIRHSREILDLTIRLLACSLFANISSRKLMKSVCVV